MTQAQILEEFSRLPTPQQSEVLQAALRIFSQKVIVMPRPEVVSERNRLAQAAQKLLPNYLNDEELTAFTALDGEPFHA